MVMIIVVFLIPIALLIYMPSFTVYLFGTFSILIVFLISLAYLFQVYLINLPSQLHPGLNAGAVERKPAKYYLCHQ